MSARRTMTLKVLDYDPMSANDPLGEASFVVHDLLLAWVAEHQRLGHAPVSMTQELKLVPAEGETDSTVLGAKGNLGYITFKYAFDKSAAAAASNPNEGLKEVGSRAVAGRHGSSAESINDFIRRVGLPAMMTLTVRRAAALKNMETLGVSDPFVKVYVDSGATGSVKDSRLLFTTDVVSSNLNPAFTSNATGDLPLQALAAHNYDEAAEYDDQYVTLEVWDKNTVKDELMGAVCLSLKQMMQRTAYAIRADRADPMSGEFAVNLMSPKEYEKSQKMSRDNRAGVEGTGAGSLYLWVTLSRISEQAAAASVEAIQAQLPRTLPVEQRPGVPGVLGIRVIKCVGLKQPQTLMFSTTLKPSVLVEDAFKTRIFETEKVKSLDPVFTGGNTGVTDVANTVGTLRFTVMDRTTPYAAIDVPMKEIIRYARPIAPGQDLHQPPAYGQQDHSIALPLVPYAEVEKEEKKVGKGSLDVAQARKSLFSPIRAQYGSVETSGDGYAIVEFTYQPSAAAMYKNSTVVHTAAGVARLQVLTVASPLHTADLTVRVYGPPPLQFTGTDDPDTGYKLLGKDSAKDTRKAINDVGLAALTTAPARQLNASTYWFARQSSVAIIAADWSVMRLEKPQPSVRLHVYSGKAFIGEVAISMEELLCNNGGPIELPIGQRLNETSEEVKNAKGRLGTLRFDFSFHPSYQPEGPVLPLNLSLPRFITARGSLLLRITGGAGLAYKDANFFSKGGNSDPLVEVHYRGTALFTTQAISKTLNPLWGDKGLYMISLDQDLAEAFTLKVMDSNTVLKREFIGAASFSPKDLAGCAGSMTLTLASKTGHVDEKRGVLHVMWLFEGDALPEASDATANLTPYVPPRAVGTMMDAPANQPEKKSNEIVVNPKDPNAPLGIAFVPPPPPTTAAGLQQYAPKGLRIVVRGVVVRSLFGGGAAPGYAQQPMQGYGGYAPQQGYGQGQVSSRQAIEQRLGRALTHVCLSLVVDGADYRSQPVPLQPTGDVVFADTRFTLTLNPQQRLMLRVVPAFIPQGADPNAFVLGWAHVPLQEPLVTGQVCGQQQHTVPLTSDIGAHGAMATFETLSLAPKAFFNTLRLNYVALRGLQNIPQGASVQLQSCVTDAVDGTPIATPAFPASNPYGAAADVSVNATQTALVLPTGRNTLKVDVIVVPNPNAPPPAAAPYPGGANPYGGASYPLTTGAPYPPPQLQPYVLCSATVPIAGPQGTQQVRMAGQGAAVLELTWSTAMPEVAYAPGLPAGAQPPAAIANDCLGVMDRMGARVIGSPAFMAVPAGATVAAVEVLSASSSPASAAVYAAQPMHQQMPSAVFVRVVDPATRRPLGTSEAVRVFGGTAPVAHPPTAVPQEQPARHALIGQLFYVDAAAAHVCYLELVDAATQQVIGGGEVPLRGAAPQYQQQQQQQQQPQPEAAVPITVGQWTLQVKVGLITGPAMDQNALLRGNGAAGVGAPVPPTATALAVRVKTIALGASAVNFVGSLVCEAEATTVPSFGTPRGARYARTMARQLAQGQPLPVEDVLIVRFDAPPPEGHAVPLRLGLVNAADPQLAQLGGGHLIPKPPGSQAAGQQTSLMAYAACTAVLPISRQQRQGVESVTLGMNGGAGLNTSGFGAQQPQMGYGSGTNASFGQQQHQHSFGAAGTNASFGFQQSQQYPSQQGYPSAPGYQQQQGYGSMNTSAGFQQPQQGFGMQPLINSGFGAQPQMGYGAGANASFGQQQHQQSFGAAAGNTSFGFQQQPIGGAGATVELEWFWLDCAPPELAPGQMGGSEVARIEVLDTNCGAAPAASSVSEVCVCVVAPGALAEWRTPFSGQPNVASASFVDPMTQQGAHGFFGQREGARTKLQLALLGRAGAQLAPQPPYYQQHGNGHGQFPASVHIAGAEVFADSLVRGLNTLPLLDARGAQVGTVRLRVDRLVPQVPFSARGNDAAEGSLRAIEARHFGVTHLNTGMGQGQGQGMGPLMGRGGRPNTAHAAQVVDVTIFGPMGHKFSTRMMPNETFDVLREHLSRHLGIAEELQELAYVNGPGALQGPSGGANGSLMMHQQSFAQQQQQQYTVDWGMTAPEALMTAQSIGASVGSILAGSPMRNRRADDPPGLTLQLGCTDRNKFFIAAKLPSGDEKPLCVDSFATVGMLKEAIAALMGTPKQRARMAAIGVGGSRGRRIADDTVYPEQLRLMVNFQELLGDHTSIGSFGIVGGSVIIVSTNYSSASSQARIRHAQSSSSASRSPRITIRLLGPDGGLGNVVQASQADEVAILRSVLVSTRKYHGMGAQMMECYVDGRLVPDEGMSLAEAGCHHNSVVQFCHEGQRPHSPSAAVPLRLEASPQHTGSIVIDVEDAAGHIQQVTVPRDAPVSIVRRYAKADYANNSSRHGRQDYFAGDDFVFLNGRIVHNEAQTIEAAVRMGSGGTHFEVRPPKGSGAADSRIMIQQHEAALREREAAAREEARQREVGHLAQQVDLLQEQLNRTVTSSRDQERRLASHAQEAEAALQEERRNNQSARERVSELERAMDRQQDLLRRAASATVPYQRSTVSLNPQVLQALARVNSPALRNY